MNNKILYAITAVWVLFFTGTYTLGLFERPITFNELGDFLAGVFAPLGFLWLIYGYRQQGKQLEQNSTAINQQAEALKQQAKALNLQIVEMKKGIEEQKKIVEVYTNENIAKHFAAEPYFEYLFEKRRLEIEEISIDEYIDSVGKVYEDFIDIGKFKFVIKNLGGVAKKINISCIDNPNLYSAYEIEKNNSVEFIYSLNPDQMYELEKNFNYSIKFTIRFFDQYGKKYTKDLYVECSANLFPKSGKNYSVSLRHHDES